MSKEDQLFWKFGKDFPKGTLLFHEGDPGREKFILQIENRPFGIPKRMPMILSPRRPQRARRKIPS